MMQMEDKILPRTSEEATEKKLTDWSNEPTLRQLKVDFDQSKPAHDAQVGRIKHWQDLLNVTGAQKPPKVKGRSSVQPKLVKRQAEWRYSALTEPFLGSNKLFNVSPVTFEDAPAAVQNELVLNWQFRTKLNRVSLIDTFVRTTVDEGTSIARIGWKRVTVKVKKEVPVYSYYQIEQQEQLQQLQQAIELEQDNPRMFHEQAPPELAAALEYYKESGVPVYAEQTGTQEVEVDQVLENRPTVDFLNPENVYIDPSCNGDLDKALFAVISFETNQAELKKEPKRYKNLDKVDWKGNGPATKPDHATTTPQTFEYQDELRRKVVAYEYWGFYDIDGDGRLQPIVATWIGDTLIRMEMNPFPDSKLPFVLVPYLPVKRDLFGEPDAELLEDNQKILGALTRGMVDLLGRSANSQRGFAKGMLDPLNRRRYDNGEDYEYNPNSNPQQQIIEHTYPELPQSAMLMLNLQNNEAESLTGVKAFAGGVSGDAYGDVAAGIRGVLDAASKREMAILRRLAKGMTEIGNKIIAMNAVFLSEEEVVRVTNSEFVTVRREDLAGNFDLEVDIATAEVDNQKSQDLAFMLQTIGPNIDPQISMKILSEIAKLKRMPELAHTLATFKPQPDPFQEQMKQLELQNKQLENQKLQSDIELNHAKAQEAMANRDQKNLDFVEQETGTKHARDMEKQTAQAQGNQALEVTKALLKPTKNANGSESKPDVPAAVGFNALSHNLNSAGQTAVPDSTMQRDNQSGVNPQLSLGSKYFDPSQDPALNPNLNI
ncbi:portal protein [Erwinia phage phiEaP8]|uniref:Portal protein n=2 Tax=Caudoviricetes TaxID=2731619 RepID=A0A3G1QTL5_9CAUD|nr:portal protein [Erwinia phage phiEaP8]AWN06201.1 portal protein [Erwinia phage phiEaP8]